MTSAGFHRGPSRCSRRTESFTDLARAAGLSVSAVHQRVRRLQEIAAAANVSTRTRVVVSMAYDARPLRLPASELAVAGEAETRVRVTGPPPK